MKITIGIYSDSFNFLRNNFARITLFLILYVALFNLVDFVGGRFTFDTPAESSLPLIIFAINFILGAVYQCSFIVLVARISSDSNTPFFVTSPQALQSVPRYILASIIVNFINFIALLFLILPGLYTYARLSLFDFGIVIKSQTPMEAIKKSWHITRPRGILISITLLPMLCIIISAVIIGSTIVGSDVFSRIIASIVFWGLGSFLILVRYRVYILLKEGKLKL